MSLELSSFSLPLPMNGDSLICRDTNHNRPAFLFPLYPGVRPPLTHKVTKGEKTKGSVAKKLKMENGYMTGTWYGQQAHLSIHNDWVGRTLFFSPPSNKVLELFTPIPPSSFRIKSNQTKIYPDRRKACGWVGGISR